jgi:hypothetical protein
MLALHSSPFGGHSGFQVTYKRLKALFAWPRMKQDVHLFVTSCTIFKQTKTERVKYPGLLMPLPIPPHAWHTVSLDFIEGLPCSSHYNCILVVVDKFSKYVHCVPLSHPFTTLSAVLCLCALFSPPSSTSSCVCVRVLVS